MGVLANLQKPLVKSCSPHQDWLQIGTHRVFLKSSTGDIDPDVDVFIDLTGGSYLNRSIPPQLQELLGTPSFILMNWEIIDGYTCNQLPNMVITLLNAGYSVGWGCVGGHGRTGWLAAKVMQNLTECSGNEAVDYVRNNYCIDAIETQTQLNDLGSDRPAKPPVAVGQSYGGIVRKYNWVTQTWEEDDTDFFPDSENKISFEDLQKGLVQLIGESDEEYEERTNLLVEEYYAQFNDGTNPICTDWG